MVEDKRKSNFKRTFIFRTSAFAHNFYSKIWCWNFGIVHMFIDLSQQVFTYGDLIKVCFSFPL